MADAVNGSLVVDEFRRAMVALALELPEAAWADVNAKAKAVVDETERCWRELDEAKALLATAYDDFNGNGSPTNSWRKRVEDLGAWPKRTVTP